MKFFLRLILIGFFSYFLSFIAPWWIITIIGFSFGLLLPGLSFIVFISGFLGVGIIWMGYAWKLDSENDSRFSMMIGEMLIMNDPMLLVVLVGIVGGLCGGFSAMTGSLFRQTNAKKKSSKGIYQ